MPPPYPTASIIAAVLVVVAERRWLRTGLFRDPTYWIAMAIVYGFMIAVDGFLTNRPHAIVRYDPDSFSGVRFPWDIPIEEFVYAFALLTSVMLLWDRAGARRPDRTPTDRSSEPMQR